MSHSLHNADQTAEHGVPTHTPDVREREKKLANLEA